MALPASYLALFDAPAPALSFREEADPLDEAIRHRVRHVLGAKPGSSALAQLDSLRAPPALRELYSEHDGAKLAICGDDAQPLLELLPIAAWPELTSRYRPDGELGWTIDLCSRRAARRFFRDDPRWIAFARCGEGPGVLVTFVEGPHAGAVHRIAPEPRTDPTRPLARDVLALAALLGDDLADVLRRCEIVGPEGVRPARHVLDADRDPELARDR